VYSYSFLNEVYLNTERTASSFQSNTKIWQIVNYASQYLRDYIKSLKGNTPNPDETKYVFDAILPFFEKFFANQFSIEGAQPNEINSANSALDSVMKLLESGITERIKIGIIISAIKTMKSKDIKANEYIGKIGDFLDKYGFNDLAQSDNIDPVLKKNLEEEKNVIVGYRQFTLKLAKGVSIIEEFDKLVLEFKKADRIFRERMIINLKNMSKEKTIFPYN